MPSLAHLLDGFARARAIASLRDGGSQEGARLALLKLRIEADDRAAVDGSAKKIGTVKALRGKGTLDVLEVDGSVYKANYRMRMIYAQIPGSCVLMGQ